ncbi:hypothetical protein P9578_08335 [Brevibacillus choshinensis]|uniref:hypothetical protein n=1 Tax=Brevibacillus choshinensis TaxID=54911 RepID=UPI002E1E6A30|nr:hypothetical protein [Brevibacillus choshinensis]
MSLPNLCPWQSLLAAGVLCASSSDAPTYALNEEHEKGTLNRGKLADMTVFSLTGTYINVVKNQDELYHFRQR